MASSVGHARRHPIRTCIATRTRHPDSQLLRVVLRRRSAGDKVQGEFFVQPDPQRKLPGRGAWITPTQEAVEIAIARRQFARAFKVSAPVDAERLCSYIKEHTSQTKNVETEH
ncbi:YlxR family protein [Corynebacterium argentoratense]|uniref:YlxR family protein n=1 Tax=Corynebacterium argentoratense TaxID=42817 RepID=UPI00248EFDDA|nr:YlxR family protein [Corynebacterium argentoratense]